MSMFAVCPVCGGMPHGMIGNERCPIGANDSRGQAVQALIGEVEDLRKENAELLRCLASYQDREE